MTVEAKKKLTINYRMEPGCLGPTGETLIQKYCEFAQLKMDKVDSTFITWVIEPRFDKSLPEVQYSINGRFLTNHMVKRYLDFFEQDMDEFEEHYNDELMHLIEEFLDRG
jgi:hypothetical protein